jgi:hypothetical protein
VEVSAKLTPKIGIKRRPIPQRNGPLLFIFKNLRQFFQSTISAKIYDIEQTYRDDAASGSP